MSSTVKSLTVGKGVQTPTRTSYSFSASLNKGGRVRSASCEGTIVFNKESGSVNIYSSNGSSKSTIFTSGGKSTAVGADIFQAILDRAASSK